jgi:hypothetical protein
MSTLNTAEDLARQQLSWRRTQLSWFDQPVMIKQDNELIEYIQANNIKHARIHGDNGVFSQYVTPVNHCCDFAIYIENSWQPFDFDELIQKLNYEIQNYLCDKGVLYLAVNKFLCMPRCYDSTLPENYNDAIVQYLKRNINAEMKTAIVPAHIQGDAFNWIHPLTRFYFVK